MPNNIRSGLAAEIRRYTEHTIDLASTSTLMALRRLLIDLSSQVEFPTACAEYLGLQFNDEPLPPEEWDTAEADAGKPLDRAA